jgi:large subunit ribosomal protein L25
MKTTVVKGIVRTELGKKNSKGLRKQDNVPCVMYGGEEVVHFYTHENAVRQIIYTPEVYVVEIDLDGKKYQAVLKDIQFHPVSDKILHLDFVQVLTDKPLVVELPVKLTGKSIGLMNGGKLRLRKRYLKVKGLINNLPEELVIDITNVNIGGAIKVEDLSYENLELLSTKKDLVVGVVSSRLAKNMEEAEAETEATAEGEEATEEVAAE